MRIAVTSTGPNLDSPVDPRFGRAAYFLVVDTETGNFEAVDNSTNVSASSGAGIAGAQLIADKKVEWVITGNIGPNAYRALSAGGIKVATGAAGSVRTVVEDFKNGKFAATEAPTAPGRTGMG